MSLSVCIPDLIANGKLKGATAERAQQLYDEFMLQYRGKFDDSTARAFATQKTLDALDTAHLRKKRLALKQAEAQARILHDARRKYDGGKQADGPIRGRAMMAHLAFDERAGGISNVEYRWHNIKQTALGNMYDVLAKFRRNALGQLRNKEDMTLMLRELHGEKTGDLNAQELADAWRASAEMLRQRHNQAGGDIGKLDDWGLPHSHDARLVGSIPREEWINRVIPALDRERMIDRDTGVPMNDMKLRDMLGNMYEAIVSEGWSRRTPSGAGGNGKSMANRKAESRVLHFKDADAWMDYNDNFGALEPWDAMMAHVDHMARDIAMMEILGPNPAATVRWMQEVVAKDAYTKGSNFDRKKVVASDIAIQALYDEITGHNRRVVNMNLALFGSSLRQFQTSTKLGGALLSSFSDAGTQMLTRKFNGLPAMGTMKDILAQMNPADPEIREMARRSGLISDEFIGRANASARMAGDELFGGRLAKADENSPFVERFDQKAENVLNRANEVTGRLADATMRASLLNAWTISGREVMGMEFFSAISTYAPKAFDELDPNFRRFLERYGMGEADWDTIRATPRHEWKGMKWIRPQDMADGALSDRLMEAVLSEIDFAVPTGGVRQRAIVNALPRGSIGGELWRTGMQFKMFPITVMTMHGARMLSQATLGGAAGYGVAFLGITTLAGALSVQLSETSKGRDPMKMDNPDFWGKAMLKGGGLGIYGDLINNAQGQYGQDMGDLVKGPSWSTAQNVNDLVMGREKAVKGGAPGEKENKRDLARFLKRETPVVSSLWYTRLAFERLFIDQLEEWQGNDVEASRKRAAKRAEKDGTQFYWEPGKTAPNRAPDWSNALAPTPDAGTESPEASEAANPVY